MTALPVDDNRPADVIMGETIHLLARRAGITQTVIAEQLGLTRAAISHKMRGSRPWNLTELQRVAHLLDVDVATLCALLPRLDSNQQPSGYVLRLVSDSEDEPRGACRVCGLPVDEPGAKECIVCQLRHLEIAPVVDLAAYRAERAA